MSQEEPRLEFDWPMYADATFAGLAVLIPIPIVDWIFEQFFRRRIPATVAKRRGKQLTPPVIKELNRTDNDWSCLKTSLLLPFMAVYWLLKRLSKKIFYFLTIKEATDQLSYYWHTAFLIDYALLREHLNAEDTALTVRLTIQQLLEEHVTTSPLLQLASRVIAGTRHILRTLFRVRRGEEDAVVQQTRSRMLDHWDDFSDYFEILAQHYDQVYEEFRNRPGTISARNDL